MTVAELMDELAKQPGHLPVKVLLEAVTLCEPELGDFTQELNEVDALGADRVSRRGGFVLIEGR